MNSDPAAKYLALLLSCPIISASTLARLGVKLEDQDLQLLTSLASTKKFAKNSSLSYTDEKIENLLFLQSGLARSVGTSKDGSERTFIYTSGGCFLGEAAFFHRQPVLYDIQFIENSTVLFVERIHLPLVLKRPQLMMFLVTGLSLTSRILAMQIEDAAFRTTDGKICRMLACLSGKAPGQADLTLTHQELADLIGVHRVNVTSTLNTLKKEGIISMETRGNIRIVNRDRLLLRIAEEKR